MADKMTFEYYGGPQRTPEWLKIKRGRIGASSLWRWLSVSKAKNSMGKPLKERLDYEKELMFERQFDTSFEIYVNSAMQDGIDYEDFARQQYEKITGHKCLEVGCYYNNVFVASPDRAVVTDDNKAEQPEGLLEIKILKDNSFIEVLSEGVPKKHWYQIQGQMFASGKPWVDYCALNFNTKKVAIIRVRPDQEFFDYLELALVEDLVTAEFDTAVVHDVRGEIPSGVVLGADIDRSDSNIKGGWAA